MKKIDQTHEDARRIVELWLIAKDCVIATKNKVQFPPEFIQKHKLGTASRPNTDHSFDIVTADNIYIEIDDYGKHSKKSQKINDGIINDYAETYLFSKGCAFYRLQKEEIVNKRGKLQDPKDVANYLKENLF